VLHLVNDSSDGIIWVSEGNLVVICIEVLNENYLHSEPNVTFNGTAALRWHRIYHVDNDGKIGGVLQNISFVHSYYICLQTLHRFHHVYDDGTYAVAVHCECGSALLTFDLKGISKNAYTYKCTHACCTHGIHMQTDKVYFSRFSLIEQLVTRHS